MKFLFILSLLFILSVKSDKNIIPYDFSKPLLHDILPSSLQEISGLTIIDSTTIACIQDENGILFLYDTKYHKLKQQFTFGLNGDYEGITRVGKCLYVLRSDGILFEIKDYSSKKIRVKTYATRVPAINNEGLCYDSINNRLLIGAKGRIDKDPSNKDLRYIYEFNLITKSISLTPAYSFNILDVNLFAKINGIVLPKHTNKKGEKHEVGLKLNTSEIAIHPITKQLYILSANDHCLFIYNTNGNLEHIEQLNHSLFNKAEGLSFYTNGDILISNEGQAHKPTLLKFNYKP